MYTPSRHQNVDVVHRNYAIGTAVPIVSYTLKEVLRLIRTKGAVRKGQGRSLVVIIAADVDRV